MSVHSGLRAARSLLFVPGSRPDRFDKAADSGADGVILDLEDALAPGEKEDGRAQVAAWLGTGRVGVVRINPPGTPWFAADLDLVAAVRCPVMLPKAENVEVITDIAALLGPRAAVLPLIETALGIERAGALCRAPHVVRAAFGSVDLAARLGVRHDDELALGYARSRLVLAAAAAGIAPPLDGPTTAVRDPDRLAADVAHARRLGFGGTLCIHPTQIPVVHQGFAPTDEDVAWARRVLLAGDSVSTVDGEMVDRPVLDRARRLLDAAD